MDRDEVMSYTVQWNDVDALRHMTSSRYAALYDDVRWQWIRKVTQAAPSLTEFVPVVVEAHILYKKELKMGQQITVSMHLDRIQGKAIYFIQEIRTADGTLASSAEYATLTIDAKARRAILVPEAFLQLFPDVPRGHGAPTARQ
jgi:YbgC/YbaW family acyl-CoA thioester hydrolase